MGGGLIQLVAYGAQDVYLTGGPQITYFKVVYRRHTNFAMEVIEHPIDSARFGGRHTVEILRNGDLVGRMYLKLQLPALKSSNAGTYDSDSGLNAKIAWVKRLGHACIKNLEVTIGGSVIDKHYGMWLDLWYELTHTNDQERGYRKLIGDVAELTNLVETTSTSTDTLIPAYTLMVPLQFWFNRNTGLALPLIALQYHQVRLNIELEEISKLIVSQGSTTLTGLQYGESGVLCDYFFLDSEERKRFAQVGHEYLIEQVQFPGEESLTNSTTTNDITQKFKLELNHPNKEVVFAARCGAFTGLTGRSTFLTYPQYGDCCNDVLDRAAKNIALGCLATTNNDSTDSDMSGWTNIDVSDSLSANSTSVVVYNATSGPEFTFVITTSSDYSGTAALPLWFNANAIVKNSLSLVSHLKEVSVKVNLDMSGSTVLVNGTAVTDALANLLNADDITVVRHNVNLADVSVPVADFTDARSTTALDISVIIPFNYGLDLAGNGNPVKLGKLSFNGHDRFDEQEGAYFNYLQPSCHTHTPADGVNVYSFALKPEEHQPSGTANLSRIDTTLLWLTLSDSLRTNRTIKLAYGQDTMVFIFGFSYNVLRIMSGMAGIAYSN